MDYWKECITEAFEDAKINATKKQLKVVIEWVDSAHENYNMATGDDVASKNHKSDSDLELERLKKDIETKEHWVLSTYPCKTCYTTGSVLDVWGRSVQCGHCDGKGRL